MFTKDSNDNATKHFKNQNKTKAAGNNSLLYATNSFCNNTTNCELRNIKRPFIWLPTTKVLKIIVHNNMQLHIIT